MITGTKLSELKNKLEDIQGTERIYVTDGSGTQKYIETNQLATAKDVQNSISEYNVSKIHPTSGIDGSNKYTLETAIVQVPSEYRTIGIKCSFINETGKPETWEYVGPEWGAVGFVKSGAGVIGDINSILDNINGEVI